MTKTKPTKKTVRTLDTTDLAIAAGGLSQMQEIQHQAFLDSLANSVGAGSSPLGGMLGPQSGWV